MCRAPPSRPRITRMLRRPLPAIPTYLAKPTPGSRTAEARITLAVMDCRSRRPQCQIHRRQLPLNSSLVVVLTIRRLLPPITLSSLLTAPIKCCPQDLRAKGTPNPPLLQATGTDRVLPIARALLRASRSPPATGTTLLSEGTDHLLVLPRPLSRDSGRYATPTISSRR